MASNTSGDPLAIYVAQESSQRLWGFSRHGANVPSQLTQTISMKQHYREKSPEEIRISTLTQMGHSSTSLDTSTSLGTSSSYVHVQNHVGSLMDRIGAKPTRRNASVLIALGLSGTVVCMIGHHVFLSHLDGRYVDITSQFWVKNATNAFSQLVVVFMGVVAISVLKQIVWQAISSGPIPLFLVDELLSLPSPKSIIFMGKYWISRWIVAFAFALLIQSFVIVRVLAPNALTIRAIEWRDLNATIPKLDFSSVSFNEGPSFGDGSYVQTRQWMQPPEAMWIPPPECDVDCLINISYRAPALSCRALDQDEITLKSFNGSWNFYEYWDAPKSAQWGAPYYGYLINYIPNTSLSPDGLTLMVNQTGPSGGVQCTFADGLYNATFATADGSKSVAIQLLSHSNEIPQDCSGTLVDDGSPTCEDYSSIAQQFVLDYSYDLFSGHAGWVVDQGLYSRDVALSADAPLLEQVFSCTNCGVDAPGTAINNEPALSFSIISANLSQFCEELFSNVTLAAMLETNLKTIGPLRTSDGRTTWRYIPSTLLWIYGPSLWLLLAFTVYGLHRAFSGNTVMSSSFSTIMLLSRNKQLDRLTTLDDDALGKEVLSFNREQQYFVLGGHSSAKDSSLDSPHFGEDVVESPAKSSGDSSIWEYNPNMQSVRLRPDTWARAVMISAFATSTLFAIGHHIFLWRLDQYDVANYSQFWMKVISNGFAQAVALCLGLVTAYSLTQSIWQVLGRKASSIRAIDHLFALPAPTVIFPLTLIRKFHIFYPFIITLTTYAVVLVSIFAPNALSVGQSDQKTVQLMIPLFDYSQDPIRNYATNTTKNDYVMASIVPPGQLWDIPEGCGSTCSFDFEYEAPALDCVDYHPEAAELSPSMLNDTSWYFYEIGGPAATWQLDITTLWMEYSMYVSYRTITNLTYSPSTTTFSDLTGTFGASICTLKAATYQASFLLANGTKTIRSTVSSYMESASADRCSWSNNPVNRLAVTNSCDLFTHIFAYSLDTPLYFNSDDKGLLNLAGKYEYDNTSFTPALANIFDYRKDLEGTISFDLKVSNLSEALVDLFSNYTLNLIQLVGDNTTSVDGKVPGTTVWKFDPFILWLVYGIAHVWVLVILLYGLYCIHDNGMPLDNKFSTIVLATRTNELDDVCEGLQDYRALMDLELRHQMKGCFVVENREPNRH